MDRSELTLDLDGEVGALYRSDGERLWRAVYGFAQDREVASDAVAEAFAQCLARGEAVRSPKAWVWRAAFRIAAADLQRRGRLTSLTGDPSYEMAEEDDELLRALALLPRNQRAGACPSVLRGV